MWSEGIQIQLSFGADCSVWRDQSNYSPKFYRENAKNETEVLLLEDPEYPGKICENECELKCHLCDICETWFHDDCNKLPKKVL